MNRITLALGVALAALVVGRSALRLGRLAATATTVTVTMKISSRYPRSRSCRHGKVTSSS